MAKRSAKKGKSEGLRAVAVSKRYAAAAAKAAKSPVGAQIWRPETDGDMVAGKILSHSWREGTDRPYCSVLIDTDSQAVMVRLGTVLVREFYERKIQDGAEVVLVYRGESPSGQRGRPAKLFSVEVVKQGTGGVLVDDEQAKYTANPKPRGKSKAKSKAKARK